MTFEDWMFDLANVAAMHNCLVKADPMWRVHYDAGMTPSQAWDAEYASLGSGPIN